jgi:hypothetical protein
MPFWSSQSQIFSIFKICKKKKSEKSTKLRPKSLNGALVNATDCHPKGVGFDIRVKVGPMNQPRTRSKLYSKKKSFDLNTNPMFHNCLI